LLVDHKEWLLNQFAFFKKRHKDRSTHQVWQEGYHPEWSTSEDMLKEKMDYIHDNPVKRGLVRLPEHWVYSSARSYVRGEASVVELDKVPV
jgi:hypothetical protein